MGLYFVYRAITLILTDTLQSQAGGASNLPFLKPKL